jgi:hypothetical protein
MAQIPDLQHYLAALALLAVISPVELSCGITRRNPDQIPHDNLLDQGTAAAKIRDELGWRPTRPSLADEFRHGSYRHQPHRRTRSPKPHESSDTTLLRPTCYEPLQTGKHLARTPGARPRERIT